MNHIHLRLRSQKQVTHSQRIWEFGVAYVSGVVGRAKKDTRLGMSYLCLTGAQCGQAKDTAKKLCQTHCGIIQ